MFNIYYMPGSQNPEITLVKSYLTWQRLPFRELVTDYSVVIRYLHDAKVCDDPVAVTYVISESTQQMIPGFHGLVDYIKTNNLRLR